MVTTSRVIVVLRGELGNQLKLAHERFYEAQKEKDEPGNAFNERKLKDVDQARKCVLRIESAIHALGRLNLGDIEDIELF